MALAASQRSACQLQHLPCAAAQAQPLAAASIKGRPDAVHVRPCPNSYTFRSRMLSSVSSLKLTTKARGAQVCRSAASIFGTCDYGSMSVRVFLAVAGQCGGCVGRTVDGG